MRLDQKYKDYYAILGVKKDAAEKEIKAAYRKLARKYHPDVNPGDKGAEDKFKDISEAYDVLGDKEKRQKYDTYGDQWKYVSDNAGMPQGTGGFGGFPGGGQRGYNPRDFEFDQGGYSFGGGGLGDLLGSLFGGGQAQAGERGGFGRRATRRGEDIAGEVTVSLAEAFSGAERKISLTLPNGERKSLTVTIPRGIANGDKLKLGKQGSAGQGGAPGDLILTVNVTDMPGFERRGNDLVTEVPLTFPEAALGAEKKIPLLAGPPQTLKFPPGVQCGQALRVKGQGMPVRGQDSQFGDLHVRVKVTVPKTLTERQRELIESLKETM